MTDETIRLRVRGGPAGNNLPAKDGKPTLSWEAYR